MQSVKKAYAGSDAGERKKGSGLIWPIYQHLYYILRFTLLEHTYLTEISWHQKGWAEGLKELMFMNNNQAHKVY